MNKKNKKNIRNWFYEINLKYESLEDEISNLQCSVQVVENSFKNLQSAVLECLEELDKMDDGD